MSPEEMQKVIADEQKLYDESKAGYEKKLAYHKLQNDLWQASWMVYCEATRPVLHLGYGKKWWKFW
jgi:hypothetical protein